MVGDGATKGERGASHIENKSLVKLGYEASRGEQKVNVKMSEYYRSKGPLCNQTHTEIKSVSQSI